MDIKKLEQRIQMILKDDNFKIKIGEEYSCISLALETLIDNIAKLNDAIANTEYVKTYYSDIFNSRNKYLNFVLKCEDLNYLMECRRKEIKLQFKDFIEEICKNNDLQEIIMKEFPKVLKVMNTIKENNENLVGVSEVIVFIDEWLDIISYDEADNYSVESLDKEFQEFYDLYLKK